MKIQYLGTAAAEGLPGPFCTCDDCRKARALGGRNIRSRSQALVDDTLLIDFPCDTFYHAMLYNVDFLAVRHCIVTHVHSDHLYPADVGMFARGFSQVPDDFPPFNFYGSEDLTEAIGDKVANSSGRTALYVLKPFEPVQIAGYTVTPLKAAHGTPHPYIYMIAKDGKTLLYAHDTDIFPEETWEYLRRVKPYFAFCSLDCTEGAKEKMYRGSHMGIALNRECRARLKAEGFADEKTLFCLNHFSHNAEMAVYDEFKEFAAGEGFLTSYDGMTVNF